mgnify:CR=1 FL=1
MNLDKMSNKQIDMLINELCIGRNYDPNAQLLDKINNTNDINTMNQIASDYYYNEDHSNKLILNSIEEETLKDIFNGVLSVEDVNSLKANGLYDKYLEYINKNKQSSIEDTKSIEEEIKLELEREDQENDARFQKEESYKYYKNNQDKIINDIKENSEEINEKETVNMEKLQEQQIVEIIDNNDIGEEVDINNDSREESKQIEDISDTCQEHDINDDGCIVSDSRDSECSGDNSELLEDLPPTTVEVSDVSVRDKLNKEFGEISSDDIITILDVMKRYKSGEKFNVYSALPKIFQLEINKAYMDSSDLNNKSIRNFLAKNFINELVTDIYLSEGINDFNAELQKISKGLGNVPGLIVDEYTDDLKQKFEIQLVKSAEEVKDTDQYKYNELMSIVDSFRDTYTLTTLLDMINEKPSILNRAYKAGRDNWNNIVFLNEEAYKSFTSPSVKNIQTIVDTLTTKYPDKDVNLLKAFAVLVHYSMEEYKHKSKICSHVYGYYITTAFVNMRFSASNSEIISSLNKVTEKIILMINDYIKNIKCNKKKIKNRKV